MIRVLVGDYCEHLGRSIGNHLRRASGINFLGYLDDPNILLGRVVKERPHVVLVDFMEPVEVGLELVRNIVKNNQSTRVIVMSGIEEDEFVGKLSRIGIDYYLVKPFTMSCLVNRINQVYMMNHSACKLHNVHNHKKIQQLLIEYFDKMGIPPHFKGHRYLMDAITLVSIDNTWLFGITKKLYPLVASNYNTTAPQVERAIRYAIDTAWVKGDIEVLQEMFPYTVDPAVGKPSNSSFIAKMGDFINLDLRKA